MDYYNYDWRPYMQGMGTQSQNYPMMGMQGMGMGMQGQNCPMTGMQNQNHPMMVMQEQQLENMYPNIYNIVNPVVESHCDNMEMKFGKMHCPNKEQFDVMTDNILSQVEPNVKATIEKEEGAGERQFGFGGRRILRDLVGILLIRNLLGRRRRPFGFFPGYYSGFPYGGY